MKAIRKIVILTSLLIVAITVLFSTSGKYYGDTSPDGQFRVYASKYNYEYLFGGEHAYANGKVILVDLLNDEIIDDGHISYIQGSMETTWTKNALYFKNDGFPTFKLPREVKFRYTKKYKNGVRKVFLPNGQLSLEYQVLTVKNRSYKIGKETSYINGKPSTVTTFEYYPDSIPGRVSDSLQFIITKKDYYKKGEMASHREYRIKLPRSGHRSCNCGEWIEYNRDPIKITKYPNCKDTACVTKQIH